MLYKKIAKGCLTVIAFTLLAGCETRQWTWLKPNRSISTTTQDRADHQEYVDRMADQNRRELGDDLDLLFMTDRPSRLSKWQVR